MRDYLPCCFIKMKMPDDANGSKTGGETRQTFNKHTRGGHVLKIASIRNTKITIKITF